MVIDPAGIRSTSRDSGSRLSLDDGRGGPRRGSTYPLDRVGLQHGDTVEKVPHAMSGHDLAGHLPHTPTVVAERVPEDCGLLPGSRPEQPTRTPNAKPVRLVIWLTVIEVTDSRRSPDRDDEVGIRGTSGEQGATPSNDLGSAKPEAGRLDSEPWRRHVTKTTSDSSASPTASGVTPTAQASPLR